jgi:DNA replication protein DnaC
MTTPKLDPDLVAALRRLRLGRIADTLPERIVLADKQDMSFEELLLLVLSDEIARRDSSAVARRVDDAGLDADMTMERFDKTAKITYDKRVLAELTSLRFVEQKRHAILLGPVGVGKTYLANALGCIACQHGYDVRFTRADQMLQTLRKSRFDNSRDDVMLELTTVDVLVLDDFALEQMTRDESKDIYHLFVERTHRASTIVTSNRDTKEGLAMFDDTLRAQSAIDRFMNAAYDLVIEGESYRPRQKPTIDAATPSPSAPASKAKGPKAKRRKR